jgi:DNA-directed RNA polymerase sigma subunit (sigma70/sigma32)
MSTQDDRSVRRSTDPSTGLTELRMASSLPEQDGPHRVSDESLLPEARAGRADAYHMLVSRYQRLVRERASACALSGGPPDDWIQEGFIGLYKAIRDFRPDRGTNFHSFVELCITRQLTSAGGFKE